MAEYLTFTVGLEEYAIDILCVQEIRAYEAPTMIANTPSFIKGVMNLRGTIIPIVDLRIKFNLPKVEYTPFTVIMVLNIKSRIIGVVVDSVSDVISISKADIKPAPEFFSNFDIKYIVGLACFEERMLVVCDIEQLMTSAEMELTNESAKS